MGLRFRFFTPLSIFGLNLLISWRLLNTEYLAHFGSIEPVFYALADYLQAHWAHPGWWREWNCGMPFVYTYQPLLHYLVAGFAGLMHWSSARAFHFVVAILYSAGPATLFLLVRRLSASYGAALGAALLYSLWSPSAWLMPDVAADIGGLFYGQRLHAIVAYGDSPNAAGLTFVPLALFLVDRAVQRLNFRRLVGAALGVIAVPLTNIPATLAMGMAMVAYCIVQGNLSIRRGRVIGVSAVFGYLLFGPWLPPSGLLLTAGNTQWMEQAGQLTIGKIAGVAAGLMLLMALSYLGGRMGIGGYTRFSVLYLAITAAIVLGDDWGHISLLAQPKRFHLAMEMAIAMVAGGLLAKIWGASRREIRLGLAGVAIAGVCWQTFEYRAYARRLVKRDSLVTHSEFKIARWLDQHAEGNRVMVPGSDAFWLKAFTATPQVAGCCDQNLLFTAPRFAIYEMKTDQGAGDRAAEISVVWLKTLGVKYVAMSGPKSSEAFHVTEHPHKFDGLLAKRWEEGDDAIFEVPGRRETLAHWVSGAEAIRRMPVNGLDVGPLLNYVRALDDPGRGAARLDWESSSSARIMGDARAGDLLSVQIPFHSGWVARKVSGQSVAIGKDALGFMLMDPRCEGGCEVRLEFSGGVERLVLLWLQSIAWVGLAAGLIFSAFWSSAGRALPGSGPGKAELFQ